MSEIWLTCSDLACFSTSGRACLPPVNAAWVNRLVLVLGPNGAGKSVLGRLITGMSPSVLDDFKVSGEVIFSGGGTRPHDPRVFAYIPQGWHVAFLGSRLDADFEMLSCRLQIPRKHILDGIASTGLTVPDLEDRSPFTLSRGERQRVALGMLAAIRPQAAFLDEPEAFLDDEGRRSLQGLFEKLIAAGTRLVIATHEPNIYGHFNPEILRLSGNTVPPKEAVRLVTTSTSGNCCGVEESPHHELVFPDHLRARFHTSLATINLQRLALVSGRLTALFGFNGSGKTTVLRSLCWWLNEQNRHMVGNHDPQQAVMVGDEPDDELMFRSIGEELQRNSHEADGLVLPNHDQIIALLGGSDRLVGELSWGGRRLLSLACAVQSLPLFLLVDEPFAGLDPHSSQLVREMLEGAASAGSSVIFSLNRVDNVWPRVNGVWAVERNKQHFSVREVVTQ